MTHSSRSSAGPQARRRAPARRIVRAVASLAVAATLILGATLAGTPATAATGHAMTSSERAMIGAVAHELGVERAAHRAPAIAQSAELGAAARDHGHAMAVAHSASHQLPGERALGDRLVAAGYRWTACGENVAYTSTMTIAGAVALERAMYAERPPNDGHRDNILSSRYSDVGIDVYLDPGHHLLWMTQDFGHH